MSTNAESTRRELIVIESGAQLSAAQKRLAARAIEDVHLAYFEKGGLRETLEKAEDQAGGVSAHIYRLAVHAAKTHGELEAAADLFRTLCEYAESAYKAEHEIDNIKDQLPVWPVFKSNILGAIKSGLSPLDHKNEHALRNARMQMMRETLADQAGKQKRIGATPLADIDAFIRSTSVADELRPAASRIVFALELVKPARQGEALQMVDTLRKQLEALVDKRRLRGARRTS